MDGLPIPMIFESVGDKPWLGIVDEIQEVYKLQGVKINDKHIEVIVRQMLKRVKIREVGILTFWWTTKWRNLFLKKRMLGDEGRREPAEGNLSSWDHEASLITDSFISAASFQETTKVLTQQP